MAKFILTRMGVHFLTTMPRSPGVSSADINMSDYISSERRYDNFILRPLIVPRLPNYCFKPSIVKYKCELVPDTMLAAFSMDEAMYEMEICIDENSEARIIDCISASAAFITRSVISDISLLPIENGSVPRSRILSKEYIEKYWGQDLSVLDQIYSGFSYDSIDDVKLWELVDAICKDDVLIYCLLFFREGLYQFEGVFDLYSMPHEELEHPFSISESVKLENSLHNFYKVIESMYGGGLSAAKSKLKTKFEMYGVNTSDASSVIYPSKTNDTIINNIIKLGSVRDKRAAHGNVFKGRRTTWYEVIEAMELASYMIRCFVKSKTEIDPLELPGSVASFLRKTDKLNNTLQPSM